MSIARIKTVSTTLLNGSVHLLQPEKGFKASTDTVFLAAAVPANAGDAVCDMGCSSGGAGLCVIRRVPNIRLTGIEVDEQMIVLARENASLNDCVEDCSFIEGDIREACKPMERQFDHVMCNPPYMESGTWMPAPQESRRRARGYHGLDEGALKDWIAAAHRLLKDGGTLTMIHRADRTQDIVSILSHKNHFGALEILPLFSKQGQPAKRVIIRAKRARKTPSILHAGLALHEQDGSYTRAAEEILRNAKAL